MPNRILKESICYSENVDGLTLFQENFFYRLIVNCDDFGRMDARSRVLSSKLYPLRDIKPAQVSETLRALAAADLIILYEQDGHPYVQMKTWEKHQQIRARKSKYPAPSNCNQSADICNQLISNDIRCNQEKSSESKCPRNPIQSNPNPNTESESESESKRADARGARFDSFWAAYPKHEAKQAARKAFDKVDPDDGLLEKMLTAIDGWKASSQWQQEDGRYIPHPATWLNQRRWEDEVPKQASAQNKPAKTVVAQQYDQRDYSTAPDNDWMTVLSILQGDMQQEGGPS